VRALLDGSLQKKKVSLQKRPELSEKNGQADIASALVTSDPPEEEGKRRIEI